MTRGDPLAKSPLYRILVTRGCPNNCSFCGVSAFRRVYEGLGRFYRVRSVESTIQELEHVRRVHPNIRRVRFDDELFVPSKSWIEEFCREYPGRVGLPFDILSSPKVLDEWTIERLARAGLDIVYMGVQTTGEANRERYHRSVHDDDVRACTIRLQAHGVLPTLQILIDDPEHSLTEQLEVLDILLDLPRPYDLFIFSLCHFPGTERTQKLVANGIISSDEVEGVDNKVQRQFIADFSVSRTPTDRLMLALYMLANKRVVPRSILRKWARSDHLRRSPDAIVALAQAVNMAKLAVRGVAGLRSGEISLRDVRNWIGDFSIRRLPPV
ncbi:MAG: radical SAM protein [Pseudomonadota bacterium]